MTNIIEIQKELTAQLDNKEVFKALVDTTFKGLEISFVKRAMMEGMMRGFKFDDFLKKNIYAVPFKGGYSLITSIDYSRKVGMRSGVVGKSEPIFVDDEKGNPVTCAITIKRKVGEYIGEYTAKVYFKEYSTGFNLWKSKPRTMIAKVAEMHALRMACPEELSQAYIEEEIEKETIEIIPNKISEEIIKKVKDATTEEKLNSVWQEHKGLGKEFANLIADQKNFINKIIENESNS